MLKKILTTLTLSLCLSTVWAQNKKQMKSMIQESFEYANAQYLHLMTQLPNGNEMPQRFNFKTNKVESGPEGVSWWCTGFYPGALIYIYEQTKDPILWKEAQRALDYIKPNQHYTGNHDLGFMMFNSYGNAYKLTKNEEYKPIIFQSAASLAKRFIPSVGVTQSWGDYVKRKDVPVIIDNMLNLELFLWVAQNGGNQEYRDMAISHADKTLENHFRPDFSSYHVVNYNRENGSVINKKTAQGYSDSSSWARGQSWGLYGYTMMYRFTKDQKYLKQAQNIAKYILNHPNLPADMVPYWDFNAPNIPNEVRDASAAALMASALLELAKYSSKKESKTYVNAASKIIVSLSNSNYRPKLKEAGGFLLLHSTGSFPGKSEIDVPIIYADYYYLEALKRYKEWYL